MPEPTTRSLTVLDTRISLAPATAPTRAPIATARPESRPDLDAQLRHRRRDRLRAPHGTAGPVEGGEEAVAHLADLATMEPRELRSDDPIMAVLHPAPGLVAHRGALARGVHDVGEQDRGEETVERGLFVLDRSKEGVDGLAQLIEIAHPRDATSAGKRKELRPGDP